MPEQFDGPAGPEQDPGPAQDPGRPTQILRRRFGGAYRADGFAGPTRRYALIVALLVTLASLPTLVAILADPVPGTDRNDGALDVPFLPPPSTGPVAAPASSGGSTPARLPTAAVDPAATAPAATAPAATAPAATAPAARTPPDSAGPDAGTGPGPGIRSGSVADPDVHHGHAEPRSSHPRRPHQRPAGAGRPESGSGRQASRRAKPTTGTTPVKRRTSAGPSPVSGTPTRVRPPAPQHHGGAPPTDPADRHDAGNGPAPEPATGEGRDTDPSDPRADDSDERPDPGNDADESDPPASDESDPPARDAGGSETNDDDAGDDDAGDDDAGDDDAGDDDAGGGRADECADNDQFTSDRSAWTGRAHHSRRSPVAQRQHNHRSLGALDRRHNSRWASQWLPVSGRAKEHPTNFPRLTGWSYRSSYRGRHLNP